jgi:hypothetical protein
MTGKLRVEELEDRRLLVTYVVATTGNDANPGTLDQPLATIQRGLALAAQPRLLGAGTDIGAFEM